MFISIFPHLFSFFLIFFWVKQISSRVSNSAKRHSWFDTPRSLPPPHCWTSSCRRPSVDGPLLSSRPWVCNYGLHLENWRLERGGEVIESWEGIQVRRRELTLNFILTTLSSPPLGLPRPMPGGLGTKPRPSGGCSNTNGGSECKCELAGAREPGGRREANPNGEHKTAEAGVAVMATA